MRVLIMTNLYPNPFQPNRAPFNRQRSPRLDGKHELRVLAPILWTDELKARWHGAAPLAGARQQVLDGIVVDHPRYYYTPWIFRGWYGHFFRWSVRRAFARAVEQFRPDVLYAPWAYPDGWAAVELGERAGLPVVIRTHGSDICLLSRYPRRLRGTVASLSRAKRIIAVSQDLADQMVALGIDPGRIEVIYAGVDHALFHPGSQGEARTRLGLPADLPVVLFVGNLIRLKGVEVLVEACARLKAGGVRFCCHLIGQGPLRSRLEAQIRSTGLQDYVQLCGSVPNAQLPDWYRAATVLAVPSHSEGIPNVLLEAAACGTPFVASRVGGIPEIAHLGTSRLVSLGDVGQLALALRDFLTNPVPRPVRAAPAIRSRADAISQLSRLLEQVVEEHRGQGARPVPALSV